MEGQGGGVGGWKGYKMTKGKVRQSKFQYSQRQGICDEWEIGFVAFGRGLVQHD